MQNLLWIIVLSLLLSSCNRTPTADNTSDLKPTYNDTENWLSYGRTYDEQRYSPLTNINDKNVAQLGLAWFQDLDTNRGQEATPLLANGVLYISTAWSKVKAFDARSGALLWAYDPQVPKAKMKDACCDAVNRGVALWKENVFVGTLDGRLIALDKHKGEVRWTVQTTDTSKPYTITGAPRVVKGKVIIGNAGAEYGVRGYVSAYDTKSGELAWRFYTTPSPDGQPEGAASDSTLALTFPTWSETGEWKNSGGGGTVWDAMAYDPALDLLYIGTGNGGPWNQAVRSPGGGDNLFISSILALRPDTGDYVWHYQTTPGDSWDYTATQHIILADLVINNVPRKVLMQAPKNGFFYVLDRETGEFISGDPYAPINWATGIDSNGRPIENPAARYTETQEHWDAMPGPPGAHSWNPMAFSQQTGLVYIPQQEIGWRFQADDNFEQQVQGLNTGVIFLPLPTDPKARAHVASTMRGALVAWDPVARKEVWRHQYPGPGNGGLLATAGNLVFQGSAAGELQAFRANDGQKLWSMPLQTGIIAPPITYRIDNEQYIAILAGWGGAYPLAAGELSFISGRVQNISRLMVFKLNGKTQLPTAPTIKTLTFAPPALPLSPTDFHEAELLFARHCSSCHGDSAVSGGITPDLRASPILSQQAAWETVLKGALLNAGMPDFSSRLDQSKSEAIRAYVANRAHAAMKERSDDRNE